MRAEIHNKLITDITALAFTGTANPIFTTVGKFFKGDFNAGDCVITTDGLAESIEGDSSTYREYGFLLSWIEVLEAAASDSEESTKVDRMSNREDVLLNYFQKEPSNLNAWGQSQSPAIDIFKIRLNGVTEDNVTTVNGYGKIKDLRFTVFVNVNPREL